MRFIVAGFIAAILTAGFVHGGDYLTKPRMSEMNDTLQDRAKAAAAVAEATAKTAQVEKFKTLLKKRLGIEANPTDTIITVDGVTLRLDGASIRVVLTCADCGVKLPGRAAFNLAELSKALEQPIRQHICKKAKAKPAQK